MKIAIDKFVKKGDITIYVPRRYRQLFSERILPKWRDSNGNVSQTIVNAIVYYYHMQMEKGELEPKPIEKIRPSREDMYNWASTDQKEFR